MALSTIRRVQAREGVMSAHPISAGSPTIHEGAIVILKAGQAIPGREGQGADNAAKAAEAATFFVVGIAEKTVTVADGKVQTRSGVFLFENSTGEGDAIARADIGKAAYVIDDETVGKTTPNNIRAKAGTIVDVESIGVWVRVGA